MRVCIWSILGDACGAEVGETARACVLEYMYMT